MLTNWRNKFSVSYYESLISGDAEYLESELKKHSTKNPEDADVVIAYRNVIVNKYNALMKEKRGDAVDMPMVCITNDLRERGIYNGFCFKASELGDDALNENWFRCGYARTLYNIQGDEVSSFYIAPEDMGWFLNGRMAYTLISSLKS